MALDLGEAEPLNVEAERDFDVGDTQHGASEAACHGCGSSDEYYLRWAAFEKRETSII